MEGRGDIDINEDRSVIRWDDGIKWKDSTSFDGVQHILTSKDVVNCFRSTGMSCTLVRAM